MGQAVSSKDAAAAAQVRCVLFDWGEHPRQPSATSQSHSRHSILRTQPLTPLCLHTTLPAQAISYGSALMFAQFVAAGGRFRAGLPCNCQGGAHKRCVAETQACPADARGTSMAMAKLTTLTCTRPASHALPPPAALPRSTLRPPRPRFLRSSGPAGGGGRRNQMRLPLGRRPACNSSGGSATNHVERRWEAWAGKGAQRAACMSESAWRPALDHLCCPVPPPAVSSQPAASVAQAIQLAVQAIQPGMTEGVQALLEQCS